MTLVQRFEPVVAGLLFIVLGMAVLPLNSAAYLWRLSEMSLFVPEGDFFAYHMTRPGGLLTWAGSFFSQFFYYPWLGWSVLTVLQLGLWVLVWRAFALSRGVYALSLIPSIMMLWALGSLGDIVFTLKSPGIAFSGTLGFGCAAALYWAYRVVGPLWGRVLLALVTAAAGYPCLGFYALLALLLYAVDELVKIKSGAVYERIGAAALSVVLLVVEPLLFFYFMPDNRLMECNEYLSGLPRFFDNESDMYLPYIISSLVLVAAVCAGRRFKGRFAHITATALMIAAMAVCFFGRYNDENLRVALDMERALDQGDFKRAIAVARAQKGRPSRPVGMLTHLALVQDGTAGDSLFTFPFDDDTIASRRPALTMRQLVSRGMFMRMGRVNDAYRWCMEDMVEYGQRAEYLKMMAKCALLNNEPELARKYLRPLSKTLFYKDFARKYEAYAADSAACAADPEIAGIRRLMSHANILAGDASMFETYLTTMTAGMVGGLPELAELSLQYNMVMKYPVGFWPRFMLYARHHERLPRHYQEAAILFSELEHKVDWRQFNIDPVTINRFERFMALAQRNARYSDDENREAFAPDFGDTYWYYYFFVKDLKTK